MVEVCGAWYRCGVHGRGVLCMHIGVGCMVEVCGAR